MVAELPVVAKEFLNELLVAEWAPNDFDGVPERQDT